MNTKRQLAESENYRVSSEYETVFLTRKSAPLRASSRDIYIGDFYGDPCAAVIDAAERFVISVGCGLIVYRLAEPFTPYSYGAPNAQWIELFRDKPGQALSLCDIVQTAENVFIFQVAEGNESGFYQFSWPGLRVAKCA